MLAARKSFSIQLPFGVDIVKGSVSIKANRYCQTNLFHSNLLKSFCYISCFVCCCFYQKTFPYSLPFGVDIVKRSVSIKWIITQSLFQKQDWKASWSERLRDIFLAIPGWPKATQTEVVRGPKKFKFDKVYCDKQKKTHKNPQKLTTQARHSLKNLMDPYIWINIFLFRK